MMLDTAAAPRIPVALIDDHTLLRNMLAAMINTMPEYEVVLEAGNGAEFIAALEATGKAVSVAIVDLHMPVMDGYHTIAWLRTNRPGTRALALTFERSTKAMSRALEAGACGFMLKNATYGEFKQALGQVATIGHYRNDVVMEPEATYTLRSATRTALPPGLALLTERERLFIRLACDPRELTNEQITILMKVHRRTVDGYRDSVFSKLNVKTRAGMVLVATQARLHV